MWLTSGEDPKPLSPFVDVAIPQTRSFQTGPSSIGPSKLGRPVLRVPECRLVAGNLLRKSLAVSGVPPMVANKADRGRKTTRR